MEKSLQEFVKDENLTSTIFDVSCKVIATTTEEYKKEELEELSKAFQDEEATFKKGLKYCGQKYQVYKIFNEHKPELVYGREGIPEKGESNGICLCKVDNENFMVTTYKLPHVSAKIVPKVIKFSQEKIQNSQK